VEGKKMGRWIETSTDFLNLAYVAKLFVDGPDEKGNYVIKAILSDGSEVMVAKAPDNNYEMGLLYIGKMLAVNGEEIIQTMRSDDDEIYDYRHINVRYP
jgi:hypothetical protein